MKNTGRLLHEYPACGEFRFNREIAAGIVADLRDIDYEEGFYILKHTISPAVLTENLFFTNEDDLAFLESREGKQAIVDLHVEGIIDFLYVSLSFEIEHDVGALDIHITFVFLPNIL